ncbi:type IX secretion system anionic LPS delivery protein PorZ [Tenacibaculum maritimum]|uniref:type IX secretion system anionic LPS delivery protein PorZ n=1 Tax=Tenacibaculum maritimum TaxID=107401 RepID=UPI0038778ECD
MKKSIFFLAFMISLFTEAQTDFSDRWEDFYSYNNVKDFVKVDTLIYAIVDNAVFVYHIEDQSIEKLSSVNGLSGETITAMYYSKKYERLVIGYENGLIEVVDNDGRITISPDITNFNQSGEKRINNISEYNDKLYVSTSFAIVVYDIKKLEFGDTYFIGNGSSEVNVKQTTFLEEKIYVASNKGIYIATINSNNLIDFQNWNLSFVGNYQKVMVFKNKIFAADSSKLVEVNANGTITQIANYSEEIMDLKASSDFLTVALNKKVLVYNQLLNIVAEIKNIPEFNFTLNSANTIENDFFLGTKEYGLLKSTMSTPQVFEEIHPEGPLSNDVFSIASANNKLWVVYGGYNERYTPLGYRKGFSFFDGRNWINTPFNPSFPVTDLNHISINPNDSEQVFISSMGDTTNENSVASGGLLEVNGTRIVNFYNHNNSSLEYIPAVYPRRITVRVSGTVFDDRGNLWVTNVGVDTKLNKRNVSGQWSSFNLGSLFANNAFGMNDIVIDKNNTLWIGTRRNGVYIYNEKGNRKRALTTEVTKGSLPNLNVRTVAVDHNNRIWLGTLSGMVVYNNASNIFETNRYDAEPIIILDDGIPKKLLGDQTINTIAVDGADNKWFGSENGGVLYTNPNGQKTLSSFNKDNSPLPSNKILKIEVDIATGKVYFATNKGIVVYNSKVASFGEELKEVYAYPNPVLSKHSSVTIDGRNGTHLPKGTNVKIVDISGNLVYETNVVEGQELQGGKVVWDKRNLAGVQVASGVYIVLLSNKEGTETSTTKIAIVN